MKTEKFEKILRKLILLSNQFLTLVGNFSINFLLFAIKAATTAKKIPRNAPARTSDPVEDIIPEIRNGFDVICIQSTHNDAYNRIFGLEL